MSQHSKEHVPELDAIVRYSLYCHHRYFLSSLELPMVGVGKFLKVYLEKCTELSIPGKSSFSARLGSSLGSFSSCERRQLFVNTLTTAVQDRYKHSMTVDLSNRRLLSSMSVLSPYVNKRMAVVTFWYLVGPCWPVEYLCWIKKRLQEHKSSRRVKKACLHRPCAWINVRGTSSRSRTSHDETGEQSFCAVGQCLRPFLVAIHRMSPLSHCRCWKADPRRLVRALDLKQSRTRSLHVSMLQQFQQPKICVECKFHLN